MIQQKHIIFNHELHEFHELGEPWRLMETIRTGLSPRKQKIRS